MRVAERRNEQEQQQNTTFNVNPVLWELLQYTDTVTRIRDLLIQGARLNIGDLLNDRSGRTRNISKRKRKFLRQWQLGKCAVQRERRAAEDVLHIHHIPSVLVELIGSYVHSSDFR